MIRLLYFSQAAPHLTGDAVTAILEASRRNNPAAGITGVLIHGGGLFMQVLEGPEHAVLRQYVKILDDRRHSGCRILQMSPANERLFQHWSMGSIAADPLEFQHIQRLRDHRMESVNGKIFTDTLREFVIRLNANA